MAGSVSPPASPAIAHLAVPDGTAASVLVLHSWWGMTGSSTRCADDLAARGFLAGCVDLYDGRIATTEAEVRALRSAPRREPMYRTIGRAVMELRDSRLSDGARVGLVGFSMGGHWAVWLAQRPEAHVGAVVLYYATRTVTREARVPVLAHFAGSDPFVTDAGRASMRRSMARHGWPLEERDYPGTGHWFAESTCDAYDFAAAELALERTTSFLRASLSP